MSDSNEWVPLSVRRGLRQDGALHSGLPDHLHRPVEYWLQGITGYRTNTGMNQPLIHSIAMKSGVKLWTSRPATQLEELITAGERDEDVYLDIIDAALSTGKGVSEIKRILKDGRSLWTVTEDGRALVERVDATAAKSFAMATRPTDVASAELTEAWLNIYGRDPDASDAWDHAIKAVEAILIPIVVPSQDKATLGHVIGMLDKQGDRFGFQIGDGDAIPELVTMLRLLWPNPDRHASAEQRRTPADQQARGVVHLAITIVQWAREGLIGTK